MHLRAARFVRRVQSGGSPAVFCQGAKSRCILWHGACQAASEFATTPANDNIYVRKLVAESSEFRPKRLIAIRGTLKLNC